MCTAQPDFSKCGRIVENVSRFQWISQSVWHGVVFSSEAVLYFWVYRLPPHFDSLVISIGDPIIFSRCFTVFICAKTVSHIRLQGKFWVIHFPTVQQTYTWFPCLWLVRLFPGLTSNIPPLLSKNKMPSPLTRPVNFVLQGKPSIISSLSLL